MAERFGNKTSKRPPAAARSRYETFHDKNPREVVALRHELPKEWGLVGELLSVSYRTDKWYGEGEDIDYKHVSDSGVSVYEPRGAQRWLGKSVRASHPGALVRLGKHMAFYVRRHDSAEVLEATPRGTTLFAAPDGHSLYVYDPKRGFLAMMRGGNLRVLQEGIDG